MSEEKGHWKVYSKPVEIDGKWYITITSTDAPEVEDRQEFDSKEEADQFVMDEILKSGLDAAETRKKDSKRKGNYADANYQLIELTEEQKAYVDVNWDKQDLLTLTRAVFKNEELDGRSTEGRSVKAYIAGKGVEVKTTGDRPRKGAYVLTDPQKTSVTALLNMDEPPSVKEMFKMIFPDIKNYSPLCSEYQALSRFVKSVNEEAMDIWEEPVTERRYKPPTNFQALIGMVNRYVNNPVDPSRALYDNASLKPAQEKNLKALLSYIRSTKFILQSSQYDRKADRELFESTFIRFVQDKAADLIPEEVDMYISAASETVQVAQIERGIQKQERLIDECLDEKDDKDGHKARLSMSLVESVNSLREKLDKSKGRLKGLIESVSGSRSKRIDNKTNKNDHLGNLLQLWSDPETRARLVELGLKEHEEDAKEYVRIRDAEDSWALIAGMDEDEATSGP